MSDVHKGLFVNMGGHMKLAFLAVSLLIAAFAAVGSLLSRGSHSVGTNDPAVQDLSQKIQEQEDKLAKTEEALRQLQGKQSPLGASLPAGLPSPPPHATAVRTQFQWVSKEETRLVMLQKHLQQEQERLDAMRQQLELTKYRLDQEEKVLGVEVIAKAVDDRQRAKAVPAQLTAVAAPAPNTSRLVDLYGETPFELPPPMAAKMVVDYTSLSERQSQLQAERSQWTSDSQTFNQMQTALNLQMIRYRKDLSILIKAKKALNQGGSTLKNPSLSMKAKS